MFLLLVGSGWFAFGFDPINPPKSSARQVVPLCTLRLVLLYINIGSEPSKGFFPHW